MPTTRHPTPKPTFAFPILPKRRGEQVFWNETYDLERAILSVPETQAGQVRLQLRLFFCDDSGKPGLVPVRGGMAGTEGLPFSDVDWIA
jgi:hypothetical protein